MLKKRKPLSILFFPNGTIQCVGQCGDEETTAAHSALENLLSQTLPPWEIRTMTVLCELNGKLNFKNLTSSSYVTYEIELFPAAQMTVWSPYHVHVFHNGKLIITGIKDISCVYTIVCDLKRYLNKAYND